MFEVMLTKSAIPTWSTTQQTRGPTSAWGWGGVPEKAWGLGGCSETEIIL